MSLARVEPELMRVPHALIDEPELPSRDEMDERKMDELVADMRANGFTSAVVLFRKGERFGTVAGHRRWHAAKRAGIAMLPALVFPSELEGIESIQFGENEKRENLSPTAEAIWYSQLLEKRPEEGTDGLAARLNVPRDRVERRLNLLAGDEEIFAALKAKKIRVGVAEELNKCPRADYRRMLLENAIRNGATVAMVTGWVAEYTATMAHVLRDVPDASAPPASSAPQVPAFFTCLLCDGTHAPENMRPVNIHGFCIDAILKPALELWKRRSEYLRAPRTVDEARELVNELTDRFPMMLEG